MISGCHLLLFSEDVTETRNFLQSVLECDSMDIGDGWLIFRLPPAEMGVHPAATDVAGSLEFWLLCDDIEVTIRDLSAKGVEFTTEVLDRGFGRTIRFKVPGAGEMGMYQPAHDTFSLPG